jgi:hypothetical protein
VRAESGFAQYLTEHPPPNDLGGWAHWLSTGNRLWYAADLIAAAPHPHPHSSVNTARAADRLLAGYAALAASLRSGGGPPAAASARAATGGADLLAWLDDLAAETNPQPGETEEIPGGV